MRKCPCRDCLMVVLCKNKSYLELADACPLVVKYLYNNKVPEYSFRRVDFNVRIKVVINSLKTKTWYVNSLLNIHSIPTRGKR